jgi:hypothetical protein
MAWINYCQIFNIFIFQSFCTSISNHCKELLNKDLATFGKERFIRGQTAGLSLFGSECSRLAEMGSGLYRRDQDIGEGESLWSLIICDHQMEQVDMPG